MRKAVNILPMLVVLLAMAACGEPKSPDEAAGFETVPASGWAYGHDLTFEPTPDLEPASGTARAIIAVRHTDAYRYSNLWLELATPVAGTDSMRLDTVNVPLADVYGHWYGRGVGVSYVTADTLAEPVGYDRERPARIRHIMRTDTITDIEQIGLILLRQ